LFEHAFSLRRVLTDLRLYRIVIMRQAAVDQHGKLISKLIKPRKFLARLRATRRKSARQHHGKAARWPAVTGLQAMPVSSWASHVNNEKKKNGKREQP